MTTIRFAQINPTVSRQAFTKPLEAMMHKAQEEVAVEFRRTVQAWKKRPPVKRRFESRSAYILFEVYIENEIYTYVSEGVRGHVIVPRNAPALVYQSMFSPKTSPGVIGSRAGGKYGPWTVRMRTNWPGIKPRYFDRQIAAKQEPRLIAALLGAINGVTP